ncbi:unnamed protein product [Vitrella brassicaformis CCMP3155]|uniref:Phospholipid/glycerol acyltransferase domain-containing protein n=2 Tax=Vitrella brassicaformis TaxID=1169539 RepID=A0A0G4GMH8_VITBC|nr:unnamed protein product [Vitrella brassicaformis CCMP3155]|eukprot:CEM31407.1 unnamed protein product [Vitrella brassicaformis CCMP3155]
MGIGAVLWVQSSYKLGQKLSYKELTSEQRERYRAFERFDLHKWNYTAFLLGGFFLMPLRAVLCIVITSTAAVLFWCVATFFRRRDASKESCDEGISPLTPLGSCLLRWLSYTFPRMLLWSMGVVWIREYEWDSKIGKAAPLPPFSLQQWSGRRGRNATVVANHVAMTDILVFMVTCAASFVSKDVIRGWPCVGVIAESIGTVFVDRETEEARKSAADRVTARQVALAEGKADHPLCIFAEGTTTNGRHVIPFKTGGFRALTPVQPAVMVYQFHWFNPSVEIVPEEYYFPLLLSQPYYILHLYWLPPMQPSPPTIPPTSSLPADQQREERVNRFANEVRQRISEVLVKVHPNPPKGLKLPDEWHGSFRDKAEVYNMLLHMERH